jgi:hypothetical protein
LLYFISLTFDKAAFTVDQLAQILLESGKHAFMNALTPVLLGLSVGINGMVACQGLVDEHYDHIERVAASDETVAYEPPMDIELGVSELETKSE